MRYITDVKAKKIAEAMQVTKDYKSFILKYRKVSDNVIVTISDII